MVFTSPGTYTTGTTVGAATTLEICQTIEAQLLAFVEPNSGLPSWDVYEDNTGAAGFTAVYDKILRSKGDVYSAPGYGDTRIYIRLVRSAGTQIQMFAFADWILGPGTPVIKGSKPTTAISVSVASAATSVDWYASVNEYEIFFVFLEGASWRDISFGQLNRSHLNQGHQGRCFSTGAVVAGAGVVIPVDRSLLSSLHIGGRVWLYPLTPDGGGTFPVESPEVCTVQAVADASITVTTLSSNKPTNTLIGEDPNCNFVGDSNLVRAALDHDPTVAGNIIYNIRPFHREGSTERDPSVLGKHYGCRAAAIRSPGNDFRGTLWNAVFWSFAAQAATDRFEHNYINERTFQPFSGLGTVTDMVRCMETVGVL